MNKKYKIGEFSKLCRVTVKTLRHYEEMGLLKPSEVDDDSGYRYYDLSQTLRLSRILHLKHLGLSLEEISDVFDEGNDRPHIDLVLSKIEHCRAVMSRLEQQMQELQSLVEQSAALNKMNEFEIKTIPARIVASHRQVIGSYDELGVICVNTIGPEMMRIGCTCPEPQYCYTVEHDKEHKETDIDVEYCEAVGEMHEDTPVLKFYQAPSIKALCYHHAGPYTAFSESMTMVLAHVQQAGMKICGSPRFCYIDGPWNKENSEEYLTEIQVPIEE